MRKLILLTVIVVLGLNYTAQSQNAEKGKILDNWSINLNAGASLFWGDVRQYKIYPVSTNENERNAAFGLILSKKLNSTFEIRGQFIRGNISGTKRSIKKYFEGQFNEYNINATINFSNLIYGNDPCRKFNIYGIGGIGFIDFRSVKKELGTHKFVASRGYSANGTVKEKMQTETVIPFGFGAKYKLDSRFELNFENIWTVANTDVIDVTEGDFKYDILTYTSLGLTYKFNLRKNPEVFAECGDYTSSRAKRGSLGDAGYFDDGSKAEKDSLKAKLKDLEDRMNNQDSKVKGLENKIKELENAPKPSTVVSPEGNLNVEALKRDIYKSILDTLRRSNPTTIISSGYMQFSVFFDVNKFNIKDEEMKKVASIAEHMKNDKALKIKVVGNADQSGSDVYNDYLSKKRAEEVYNTLINKYNIEKSRLSLDSKGKRDPFSKEHFSVNRRVDFIKE